MGISKSQAGILAWWPLFMAPAVIVLVLLTRDTPMGAAIRTHDTGPLPPLLPLLAGVVALAGAVWRRSPLLWLLGALGLLFFLREVSVPGTDDHLPGIKKGVYLGLVLLGVWGYVWRERLRPWVHSAGVLPMLATMCVMYGLSQAIARGGLKFVSELSDAAGQTLRTPMEESCETAGHLMLLGLVVWVCLLRRPSGDRSATLIGEECVASAGGGVDGVGA